MAFGNIKTTLFYILLSVGSTLASCSADSNSTPHPDYAQRNLDTIRKIYNLTVYPNNVPIVTNGSSAVPPGLFDKNALGRVSPLGNFTGFADSIEYFFALAPTPQAQAGQGIYRADLVEFTSGCADVASSVVYLRTGHVDPKTGELDKSKPTSTLSQVRKISTPTSKTQHY
jgi:hypothetical protein